MLHCSYDVTGQEAFGSRVIMMHAIVSGREGWDDTTAGAKRRAQVMAQSIVIRCSRPSTCCNYSGIELSFVHSDDSSGAVPAQAS